MANRACIEPLEVRAYITAGGLDLTIGAGGKVTTDFPSPLVSRAFSLAPLSDGRVVAFARATVGDAMPLAMAKVRKAANDFWAGWARGGGWIF